MSAIQHLDSVSDQALIGQFTALVKQDQRATADLLSYLDAIDRWQLWAKLGYSSLFVFCQQRFNMSEVVTGKRIGAFVGQKVLVVGPGSSGMEIAFDLAEAGVDSVSLAVRTPPNILLRSVGGLPGDPPALALLKVPQRIADAVMRGVRRLTVGDLSAYGLPSPDEGSFARLRRDGAAPTVVDKEVLTAVRSNRIQVVASVKGLGEHDVLLDDGQRREPQPTDQRIHSLTATRLGPRSLVAPPSVPSLPGRGCWSPFLGISPLTTPRGCSELRENQRLTERIVGAREGHASPTIVRYLRARKQPLAFRLSWRQTVKVRVMSLLLIVASALGGCNKRESTSACWNARQQVRDTIVDGDLKQAEQLLLQARATCNGQSADDLRRLQELLVDRRKASEAMQQAEAERQRALEVPTQRFVHWATVPEEQFSKSLVDLTCQERGSPDFGFCTATRKGQPDMRVRYWRSDRSAIRYSFTTSLPLECEDLGEHRRLRQWSTEGTKYELCELTERETRNLSALLVRAAGENTMHLYSFEYLKHDPEFEQLTRGRGKQR